MSALRIHGDLFPDILVDRRCRGERWIYVVQREGSPEILAMGDSTTREQATEQAARVLQQFFRFRP